MEIIFSPSLNCFEGVNAKKRATLFSTASWTCAELVNSFLWLTAGVNWICYWQVLLKHVDVVKGGCVDYNDFLANFEKSETEVWPDISDCSSLMIHIV